MHLLIRVQLNANSVEKRSLHNRLRSLGIHKFYLGKIGMGILYLLFCWTGIPAIVGLIEGIIYLCSNDENFQLKHHVRLQ